MKKKSGKKNMMEICLPSEYDNLKTSSLVKKKRGKIDLPLFILYGHFHHFLWLTNLNIFGRVIFPYLASCFHAMVSVPPLFIRVIFNSWDIVLWAIHSVEWQKGHIESHFLHLSKTTCIK